MSQDQLTETARSTGTVSTDIESAVRRIRSFRAARSHAGVGDHHKSGGAGDAEQ